MQSNKKKKKKEKRKGKERKGEGKRRAGGKKGESVSPSVKRFPRISLPGNYLPGNSRN